MRIHVLFLILFILLFLSRTGEMLYSFSQYRVASALESTFNSPQMKPRPEDEQQMAALQEQKRKQFQGGVESGMELLLLAGIAFCFFRAWGRRDQDDVFVLRSKMSHAA